MGCKRVNGDKTCTLLYNRQYKINISSVYIYTLYIYKRTRKVSVFGCFHCNLALVVLRVMSERQRREGERKGKVQMKDEGDS